jgi:hypothetical protein
MKAATALALVSLLVLLAFRPQPLPAPLESRTVWVAAEVERSAANDTAELPEGVSRHWLRPDGDSLARRVDKALGSLSAEGWSLVSAVPVTAGEAVSAASAGKDGWGVPSGAAFGHGTSATLGLVLIVERPKP